MKFGKAYSWFWYNALSFDNIVACRAVPSHKLNKLETRQLGELILHHQNISNPLIEQIKVSAILQA